MGLRYFFSVATYGLLGIFFLQSCQEKEIQRPRDPWAIRSVLDNQPRMLTLAMHPEAYMAYDLSKGTLYKVWKGDIALNGAPFNNLKTIQPTSVGSRYVEDTTREATWTLRSSKGQEQITYLYRGYRLQREEIVLRYGFYASEGDTIWVEEQPEIGVNREGAVRATRAFSLKGLASGDTLHLKDAFGEVDLYQKERVWEKDLLLQKSQQQLAPTLHKGIASGSRYYLEKSGCNTCHEEEWKAIGPAYKDIAAHYQTLPRKEARNQLVKKVKQGGSGTWGQVAMPPHPHISERDVAAMVSYILQLAPLPEKGKKASSPKALRTSERASATSPGWGAALDEVHPSLDLIPIRPAHFKPKVGAMDFLPDGRLLVSTWDSIGAVYILSGIESNDTAKVQIKRIAEGLAEPLGIKVVDGNIFVLQKQELTQLIDTDGDEQINEYRSICSSFDVSSDFHEFSYGLEFLDGYFYANLGLAMRQMAHEQQLPDRGRTIRIHPSGSFEWVNHGLRQANGIGKNAKGEIFITENQGRWVPACKVIHLKEGTFEGCRLALKDSLPDWEMRPPAVWLPQDEIGNSPGQPIEMLHGPYKGQLLHGDVTHGGIKRVYMEKVKGSYQGCVFRFSQGLEAGINRMAWAPDSTLYVGGVGMNGNWGWKGAQYGLQKLVYTDEVPFEMLRVEARPEGIAIDFTEGLSEESLAVLQQGIRIQQWRYEPGPQYGGPKLELEELEPGTLSTENRGSTLVIPLPDLKKDRVIYTLLPKDLTSAAGSKLWSGEAWYTMNEIPEG